MPYLDNVVTRILADRNTGIIMTEWILIASWGLLMKWSLKQKGEMFTNRQLHAFN